MYPDTCTTKNTLAHTNVSIAVHSGDDANYLLHQSYIPNAKWLVASKTDGDLTHHISTFYCKRWLRFRVMSPLTCHCTINRLFAYIPMMRLSRNDFPVPALPVKNMLRPRNTASSTDICSLFNFTGWTIILEGLMLLQTFCFLLIVVLFAADSAGKFSWPSEGTNFLFTPPEVKVVESVFASFLPLLAVCASCRSLIVSGDISVNARGSSDNIRCLWDTNPFSRSTSSFVWKLKFCND